MNDHHIPNESFPSLMVMAYRLLYWATVVSTAVFFVLILLNVIARFVLKAPIMGSVELSRLFFIWASFLGATLCYYHKSHITLSFLVDRFAIRLRHSLSLLVYVLSLLFFLLVGYESLQLVGLLWKTSLPITRISQAWLYVPVPVSMAFLALFTLQFIRTEISLIRS
jgi:TRAP-type C4-dicarboxylate transport system permease small subunit